MLRLDIPLSEIYAQFRRNLEKNGYDDHVPEEFKDKVRLEILKADLDVRGVDLRDFEIAVYKELLDKGSIRGTLSRRARVYPRGFAANLSPHLARKFQPDSRGGEHGRRDFTAGRR